MSRWLELYRVLTRISLLDQIQYRASGLIWMTGSILEPLVFFVVWATVARARGGDVAGYGVREFAAYYIVVFLVNHLTFSWIMHTFQYRVQQGSLSFELLRPVHPIHNDLTENLAYKWVMMIAVAPAIVVMVAAFSPRFVWLPWSQAAFLGALLLAFALRFLLEWTLGLAAFWTTRVMALNQLYFGVSVFLSGRFAPLAVFPERLQDVGSVLPFYYTLAFPVDLALGRLTPELALRGFGFQLLWLAFAAILITQVWRRALRRFTAVGA